MKILFAAALALLAGPALAQQAHQHHQPPAGQLPYAGLHQRAIKALSDTQIADLKAGRGMGLALAAELNGYPGPMHVLELKEPLRLSEEQTQALQRMYDRMKAEAIAAGEDLIASERALDQHFAQRVITPQTLAALTADVGARQSALRAVHLKYHLSTADLLTVTQRQRYAELRGYR